MGLDIDGWIHSERIKTKNHWRPISQECAVVERPCVVAGSNDPRSMMIPPKGVVLFLSMWFGSSVSNQTARDMRNRASAVALE